jgi:hypothetical protein
MTEVTAVVVVVMMMVMVAMVMMSVVAADAYVTIPPMPSITPGIAEISMAAVSETASETPAVDSERRDVGTEAGAETRMEKAVVEARVEAAAMEAAAVPATRGCFGCERQAAERKNCRHQDDEFSHDVYPLSVSPIFEKQLRAKR